MRILLPCPIIACLAACAGSGGNNGIAGPASNVVSLAVNSGPTGSYTNGVFTSVTICVPGSQSQCQTIGGVLVDTGSSGLRILQSVLTIPLPQQMTSNNNPVVECLQFQDGFVWGPVQTADIKLGGEQASSVPIQVIGESAFPTLPDACTRGGLADEDTLNTLNANGLLGIGLFRQDCGSACGVGGASNPNVYFECTASGCQPTIESTARQVQNPVWMFPKDNNGVIVELPSVPAAGAISLGGSLVFGIGTESNNALGGATVLTVDLDGSITTIYKGSSYGSSFIDTGSNAIYFLDARTSGLPICGDASSFYCPATAQNLTATNRGVNGATSNVNFTIGNADAIFANSVLFVAPTLGGPNPGNFDWGLPFFYGRNVFTAIEGQGTPGGVGPYFAY